MVLKTLHSLYTSPAKKKIVTPGRSVIYWAVLHIYIYWFITSPFRWFTVKELMWTHDTVFYTIKHNSSQVNGCAFLIRVAVLIPLWTTDGIYKLRHGGGSCILLSCSCTITSTSTSSRGSGIFSLFFKTHPWYVLRCSVDIIMFSSESDRSILITIRMTCLRCFQSGRETRQTRKRNCKAYIQLQYK